MEDSDRNADGPVKPPVILPAVFPVVGRDLVPTAEDIAAGRFGNGAWNLTDDSVEKAYMEVTQQKRQDKDERREFFHEQAKDALADAVKLHGSIIRRGNDVMALIEGGGVPSRQDMAMLSMAQKSSKELVDRANGRVGSESKDSKEVTTVLSLIQRKPEYG